MVRRNNIPVSQDTLKQKAQEYHQQFINAGVNLPIKFQEQFGISQHVSSRQQLEVLLEQYLLKNIFNADETGLFFRLGPDKTLASKSDLPKAVKEISSD